MDTYDLTDDERELARMVREFADEVVAPRSYEADRTHTLPLDVVAQMGELGLFGLPFPEEYGGQGGDYFALCLAIEALGRVDQSLAITLEAGVSLGAMPVFRFGTEEQKQELLPDLLAGRALAGFGLTEPEAGSDAGATRTTARLEGDEWVINGSKQFITNSGTGDHAVRDRHRRDRRARRPQGDLDDHRAERHPGIHRRGALRQGRLERLRHASAHLPGRARARGEPDRRAGPRVRELPPHPRRGPHRDRGARRRARPRDASRRPSTTRRSAPCSARRCRRGRASSSCSPACGPACTTRASRGTTRRGCATPASRSRSEAAIAKLTASDAAMDNARDATQIFGGNGFMNEYPVARHYRDSKILEIGEGTTEVQLLVIARALGVA